MTLRLTLLAHAATAATRQTTFPLDEGLEPLGRVKAQALAGRLGRVDTALVAPALRTRQTAEALALRAAIDPALADIGLGRWAGQPLADVAAAEPDGLARWTADPTAAPHGGETVMDLLPRVAGWLERMQAGQGRIVAVTHAAIIRAAMLLVLDADPRAFWRIDVEPLCCMRLHSHGARWTLRSIGPMPAEPATGQCNPFSTSAD